MEKLTKKQPINTLKEGDFVRDLFVVKIKKSIMPYAKGHSFALILADSSGSSIEYKYWGGQNLEKVKEKYDSIKSDSVIFVNGRVVSYQGKLQLSADELGQIQVLTHDEYEADFIISAKKDVELMNLELISKINSLSNSELKNLLLDIFQNDFKDIFKKHPGAISIHHNWVGGLLQHTLEVLEYCETSLRLYPELDRDLLISGAILHDIGKLQELEITSRIKGSRRGQLIGHLTLGTIYLQEKLKNTKLDELFKDKLMHMIVSHHGKMEFGSPKIPMLPEALALYIADEMSSKVSEIIEQVKENRQATEDDFMYDFKKGTNLFLR